MDNFSGGVSITSFVPLGAQQRNQDLAHKFLEEFKL